MARDAATLMVGQYFKRRRELVRELLIFSCFQSTDTKTKLIARLRYSSLPALDLGCSLWGNLYRWFSVWPCSMFFVILTMIIIMIIIIDKQRQILTQEPGLLTSSWMAAWAASRHSCANIHLFSRWYDFHFVVLRCALCTWSKWFLCHFFFSGMFYRSASLYHPQRRAIMHLKNQKRFFQQPPCLNPGWHKVGDPGIRDPR